VYVNRSFALFLSLFLSFSLFSLALPFYFSLLARSPFLFLSRSLVLLCLTLCSFSLLSLSLRSLLLALLSLSLALVLSRSLPCLAFFLPLTHTSRAQAWMRQTLNAHKI